MPCQKPMLRQVEWGVQNGPFQVLPVAIARKFCFSIRASYKKLMWYTNHPNAHNYTFCKRWSFIWECFFLECIFLVFLSLSSDFLETSKKVLNLIILFLAFQIAWRYTYWNNPRQIIATHCHCHISPPSSRDVIVELFAGQTFREPP